MFSTNFNSVCCLIKRRIGVGGGLCEGQKSLLEITILFCFVTYAPVYVRRCRCILINDGRLFRSPLTTGSNDRKRVKHVTNCTMFSSCRKTPRTSRVHSTWKITRKPGKMAFSAKTWKNILKPGKIFIL